MGTDQIAREAWEDYNYEQRQPNPLPLLSDSAIKVELSYANQDWHQYAALYQAHRSETHKALIDAWFREEPFPAMIEEHVYEWGQAWLDENQDELLPDY